MRTRGLIVGALVGLVAACGSSATTPTPTPTMKTDTFSETLAPNGAFTHTFSAGEAGTVTATLTAVSPDSAIALGFSMGTYSTATSTCQAVLANDLAVQGAVLTATAQTAGNFCVRLFDVGKVTAEAPQTYTVTVTHPQ